MFRRKLRAQSDLSLVLGGRKSQRRGTATSPDQSNSSNNNNNSKGVLKYLSADESLKSVYGSERSSADVSGSSLKQRPKSSSSNRKSLGRSRSVIFTAIEIREYGRTVGDNPSCSSGPPMSISWEYNPEAIRMPLDDYEDRRPERRTLSEMVLPRTVRDHILRKEWDVSQQQIASAIRETLRVKHSRRQTVNNIGKDRVEEVLEKTGRKLMRGLLLKKSTTSAFEKLEQQYKAVEAEKKLLKLKELMKVQQQEDGVEGSMTDVQVMQDSAPREGGLNEDDDDDDGCDESGEEIKLSCSDESRYQCKGEQTAESEIHSSARSSTNKFPIVPEAAADSHSDDTTDHATQPMVHQANDNLSRTSVVCSRDDEKGHLDQLIAGGAAECAPHSSNSSSKAESALTLPTTGVNREDDTALVTQAVLVHQSDNRSTEGVVIGGIHDENSRSDQPITTTGAVRSINSRKRMMAKNFNTASVEV